MRILFFLFIDELLKFLKVFVRTLNRLDDLLFILKLLNMIKTLKKLKNLHLNLSFV